MCTGVPSCFEKLKSFSSYGRQVTYHNRELSGAPNITLVSLLINQSQCFESKIFYWSLLLSVCLTVSCLGVSLLSSVSHPCLAPEGWGGGKRAESNFYALLVGFTIIFSKISRLQCKAAHGFSVILTKQIWCRQPSHQSPPRWRGSHCVLWSWPTTSSCLQSPAAQPHVQQALGRTRAANIWSSLLLQLALVLFDHLWSRVTRESGSKGQVGLVLDKSFENQKASPSQILRRQV